MKHLLSTTALVLTLAFSGMAYAHDGHDGHDGPPPPFEAGLSKLPQKDADAFRATMKASHEKDKALFEQMHKLHDELHDIMTAETFDKGAFIAKSKELNVLHDKMHAHMTEAFATALSQLSQDERKTMADAMKHGHHGMHHHDHGGAADDNAAPPEGDQ